VKKLSTLLVVSALALGACGGGQGATAATVNGETISVGEVEELIFTEEGTITKEQFAQFLGFQIQWNVIQQGALEEYGIEFTDDEIAAEADRVYEEFAAEGETREDFTSGRGVTEEFLQEFAHQQLINDAIVEILSEDAEQPAQEDIDTAMESAVLAATEVCVSHILLGELTGLTGEELETAKTDAEAEALDTLDRLAAGEEFADLAEELSKDPGSAANGGDLGCSSPAQYVEPFRDASLAAPIGEVLDTPVETTFGFHVMLVNDRTEPTEDQLPTEQELADGLIEQAIASDIETWVLEMVADSVIEIEERFGTWQTDPTPAVVPPVE
jgi:parvulin-like peptidyl-prolyl isomerase